MTLEEPSSIVIPDVSCNPGFQLKRTYLLVPACNGESNISTESARFPSRVCVCVCVPLCTCKSVCTRIFAVPRPPRVIENFSFPRSARSYQQLAACFGVQVEKTKTKSPPFLTDTAHTRCSPVHNFRSMFRIFVEFRGKLFLRQQGTACQVIHTDFNGSSYGHVSDLWFLFK